MGARAHTRVPVPTLTRWLPSSTPASGTSESAAAPTGGTHPATTTHRATGPEGRAKIGLTDSMLRLSVGLENVDDLIADLDRALG